MPPGRRKSGQRAKVAGELSLGDLVLAKVKGFPAWPAKVRPSLLDSGFEVVCGRVPFRLIR